MQDRLSDTWVNGSAWGRFTYKYRLNCNRRNDFNVMYLVRIIFLLCDVDGKLMKVHVFVRASNIGDVELVLY
jgi:hypothetical protein